MNTFFRVIGLLIALASMLGFGICGLMGIAASFGSGDYLGLPLFFGLIGLLLAALSFWAFTAMTREAPPNKPDSDQ